MAISAICPFKREGNMSVDLNDLRVFRSVARLGSMTQAAGVLHCVQSNVTARIRRLEDSLDVRLFFRKKSGVSLTPAGKMLLDYAERIAGLVEESERAVKSCSRPSGILRIGAIESTAFARLPPVIESYRAKYPEVDVILESKATEKLVSRVLEREIDAAFVAGPVRHRDLQQHVFLREELVFVGGTKQRPVESLADLSEASLFLYGSGCHYRAMLDRWLKDEGIYVDKITTLDSLENILNCVRANLGFSIMARGYAEEYERMGVIRIWPIHRKDAEVITSFIYKKDNFLLGALKAFVSHIGHETPF
jgi:DNA-binding transcriptional LysR family regulator